MVLYSATFVSLDIPSAGSCEVVCKYGCATSLFMEWIFLLQVSEKSLYTETGAEGN